MAVVPHVPEVDLLCSLALKKDLASGDRVLMRELARRIRKLNGVSIETKKQPVIFKTLLEFAETRKKT